jgi:hypothetical protein
LFLLKQGTDTLLVQIYMDDIIFGGSKVLWDYEQGIQDEHDGRIDVLP